MDAKTTRYVKVDGEKEPAAELLEPGDLVVGKYCIDRVIGRGGMGVVYLATHEALSQKVALKVLLPAAARDASSTPRFLNEARAAARLKGDHVAAVMDVGLLDSGLPYMVLEYLEGSDLSAVAEARGPLPVPEVADYVIQALSAIAQAHAAGIVHRDLKPGNLFLVDRPDGTRAVKVLDFGISKVEGAGGAELTHAAAVLGSPGYMAPEQVRSSRSVDGRADIWSLGVILYRLLSGHLPFPGDSVGAVLAAVLEQPPPPLGDVRPDVPEELERVVMKCLEKERDQRWGSAADLAAALAPFASADGQRLALRIAGTPGGSLSSPSVAPRPPASARSVAEQSTLLEHAVAPAPRSHARRSVAILAAVVIALAAFAAQRARHDGAARGEPTPAAASAGGAPVPWFERTPPGASESYGIGLRGIRNGSRYEVVATLEAAEKENVWLAPAYLRRSIVERHTFRKEQARIDFAHAVDHQDRLDARDLPLLEAYRHVILDAPPDEAAWEGALARVSDLHPTDPELAYYAGFAHGFRGDPEAAIASYDRAVAGDPQFAAALAELAFNAVELGDNDRARRAVDTCLALPRRSPLCSKERIRMLSRSGDAAGVLAEAEAWLKADPEHSSEASAFRAEAMFALGRPLPVVLEAARQRTRRLGDDRSRTRYFWERQLALLSGDFLTAQKALDLQRDFTKNSSVDRVDHAAAAWAAVELDEETGRTAEAAAIAAEFLAREEAWVPDERPPHVAILTDPVPKLLAAELRAKTIDRAAFVSARDAWVAKWRARLSRRYLRYAWLQGYAAVATTKELADEALAARASLDAPGDPSSMVFEHELATGRVYAAAGDLERARPHLEQAVHRVWTLHAVIDETQAEELLGESLEKTSPAGACAAYASVLGRWGGAKASVTAARAREKSRALGCPGTEK